MLTPDQALANLRTIQAEFTAFCAIHGAVNEADTRANLIDKVLTQVCDWPEELISREKHVDRGYVDYSLLIRDRPFVVVEAKKEGVPFIFPNDKPHKTLKLSGAIFTNEPIREAITQVRGYCDDVGARYAVATNGYAWIVFRAIREDKPWRDGHTRIFQSLESIAGHFVDFWNLLSYGAISSGSLDSEFGSPRRAERELHRVVSILFNADLPLQRNRLHAQLHPFIKTIFEDIADQHQIEVLQSCYVHTQSLHIVANDLDFVITDSIPSFLAKEGTEQIRVERHDAGAFGQMLQNSVSSDKGQLCLLLGGIGSGKSTFFKRYQRTVGKKVLDENTLWFSVDFLSAPVDSHELEIFVWKEVLNQLRTRYRGVELEIRKNIKKAFAGDIAVLNETAFKHLHTSSSQYEKALSPYLEKWQADVREYVPRLLSLCKPEKRTKVVIFVDNVDQLSPAYQAQIFLLSQRITRIVNSITIVALREESYYTANVQKTFTAYTNRKFHIASPRFLTLIDNRLNYALRVLSKPDQLELVVANQIAINKTDIADYLKIIGNSIFQKNRNIVRFIEAICFGNMRLALDMFTTFLASGATDVDKMLRIYRKTDSYNVAFHEFVKSIMLGDRRYYKESHSPVMNLFDCGLEKNSSHFTSIRILALLLQHRGESTPEGQGYFEISKAAAIFEDVFDNREDFIRSINRLVARQLVELDTRSTENIQGASHVRATSAGWYNSSYLVNAFSYLDLVLQDTPINSNDIAHALKDSVRNVDNLYDRDEEKIVRMQARFSRVEKFLSYLEIEETAEFQRFDLSKISSPVSRNISKDIGRHYSGHKDWIYNRLIENRERPADEFSAFEGVDKALWDINNLVQGDEPSKPSDEVLKPSSSFSPPSPEARKPQT